MKPDVSVFERVNVDTDERSEIGRVQATLKGQTISKKRRVTLPGRPGEDEVLVLRVGGVKGELARGNVYRVTVSLTRTGV